MPVVTRRNQRRLMTPEASCHGSVTTTDYRRLRNREHQRSFRQREAQRKADQAAELERLSEEIENLRNSQRSSADQSRSSESSTPILMHEMTTSVQSHTQVPLHHPFDQLPDVIHSVTVDQPGESFGNSST